MEFENENEEYEGMHDHIFGMSGDEDYVEGDFSAFDNSIVDIDFSEIRGKDFKKSFNRVNRKLDAKRQKATRKPLTNEIPIVKGGGYKVKGAKKKQIGRVIVPRDKKVIIEGVNKFILSQNKMDDMVKNIGYYKGKKLKPLILTFNNNSALDFEIEIFNPSMPLDYLYSTSLNLNDKVQIAGGAVSYTDVLHNLLANPTLIPNCKFVFSGPLLAEQISEPLIVTNRSIEGVQKIHPLNLNIQIDNMQVANDIVFFDIMSLLNRAFIPDGMDVIKYTVKPGMTVTMAFFYKQISLKKVFFEEARNSKGLL